MTDGESHRPEKERATRLPTEGTVATVRLVSVVIPMYNAAEVIADQLEALAAQEYDGDWEVVVADNGSNDESVDVAQRFEGRVPALRVVDASARQGASSARNVGSREARGDVLLYADADDKVAPGWLSAMAGALESSDFVGGWRTDDDFHGTYDATTLTPPAALRTSFGFLPWAFGGNCGIRTTVFHEVGGWDEDYPHGGDDIIFCWRVQLAGYPLVYVPDAVIRYRSRETVRGLVRQHFEFGSRAAMLLREFQEYGATRPPLRRAVAIWLWVLTRFPYVLVSRYRRRMWASTAAGAAGRLWGSVRWRTVCV